MLWSIGKNASAFGLFSVFSWFFHGLSKTRSDTASERIHVARVGPIISRITISGGAVVAADVTPIAPLVGINVSVALGLSFAEESGG